MLPRKRRILCACDPTLGRTAGYRMESLRRLGQEVIPFDVPAYEPRVKLIANLRTRFPAGPLIQRINRDLIAATRQHRPDVVWFDKPIYFTENTIRTIRQTGALTVCYNQDNPFGLRNDGYWHQFRKVFRLFDLHCVPRNADIVRYKAWGLNFIKFLFSYEPAAHFPPPAGWSDASRTRGISYVGNPYEERPQFLMALAAKDLPVVLSGPRWQQHLSPDLFHRYVSDGYLLGTPYREAIWKSKINLSFVTQMNEDDIAHKAVEISACQGFLLAVRTPGHEELFDEDREAVFFSSVEECADKCRFYLPRPDLREAIARRGRERAARSGYDNDTQLARILDRLDGASES